MLFWITIIGLGLTIWWGIYTDWDFAPIFLTAFIGFIVICMVITICIEHIGVEADIERYYSRYEMLKTQYENNFYDNDNDIGKYELVSKIQDWNEDLAYNKKIQRDLWLGIFHPNIYDQFDFIELK